MSLDIAHLRAVSSEYSMDLDSRCRSIARNAVQASRDAHGRGAALYTDDEAKRERMIEQILHLDLTKYEGGPTDGLLVAQVQPSDPTVNTVARILELGLEEALRVTGPQGANVEPSSPPKTPKPAQSKA